MVKRSRKRGESDGIHADFPEKASDQIRLSALSVLDVLALPESRMAQRGREWVLARYGVTESDVARYQPEWEAGKRRQGSS